MWKISFIILLIVFNFINLSGFQASAEENPFSVKFNGRYSPKVDVDGQAGELEYTKVTLRLRYQKTLENGYPFYINIGPDHYIFNESTAVSLPADAKSRGIRLGSEIDVPFVDDERFLLGFELNPTFQTSNEYGFDGDGFRFNFSTFLKFNEDDDFVWVLGAKIRPEYDMVVLPIFGFNYRLNDQISFNLVSVDPNISYTFTDKTKLLFEFDYTFDEFEEIGDALDGSILQIQEFAAGVGFQHTFNEHISSSIGVGGVFDRLIKYQDGKGKVSPENAVYFKAKVDAAF